MACQYRKSMNILDGTLGEEHDDGSSVDKVPELPKTLQDLPYLAFVRWS